MADDRERRAAANEALFRAANERIRELNQDFASVTESGTWVCECADPACVDRIELSLERYAGLREHPARFVVKPGHELIDLEAVVAEGPGYLVVEKRAGVGRARAEAEERDERRRGAKG